VVPRDAIFVLYKSGPFEGKLLEDRDLLDGGRSGVACEDTRVAVAKTGVPTTTSLVCPGAVLGV
jgi:hypothetical protein